MKLATRLEPDFSRTVQKRGENYFRLGKVRLNSGNAYEVDALVSGSQPYGVSLVWTAPKLSAHCTCDYFETSGPCKHLWAALLAADERGYLSDAAKAAEVSLEELLPDEGEDFDDAEEEEFQLVPPPLREVRTPVTAPLRAVVQPAVPAAPTWAKQISEVTEFRERMARFNEAWPAKKQLVYQISLDTSIATADVIFTLGARGRKADGSYTAVGNLSMRRGQLAGLPVAEDRRILSALMGGAQYNGWSLTDDYQLLPTSFRLGPQLSRLVVPMAVRSGRCFVKKSKQVDLGNPLIWDDGPEWRFELAIERTEKGAWALAGCLRRADERMELTTPVLITQGLLFTNESVALLAEDTPLEWLVHMRRANRIEAPPEDGEELLVQLLRSAVLPELQVPEELRYEDVTLRPRPVLRIGVTGNAPATPGKLRASLLFDYDRTLIRALDHGPGVYDSTKRRFLRRDKTFEEGAMQLLSELGFKLQTWYQGFPKEGWELIAGKLPKAVRTLVEAGWQVEAEGKEFRRADAFRAEVASGVDWFELHGEVDYGQSTAKLPALLEALNRGENLVRLDDGSFGILPEEWLHRFGTLAGFGTPSNGHVRFGKNQAGLLDALLAAQPEVSYDAAFAGVREQLRVFEGVNSAVQPAGFVGQLRDYQREGLGWMDFLRRFSFGGCLADDMGVGKTAQVLAMLETRRESRAAGGNVAPSLVVVPKSLVFNWKQEAARFTPQLRVLDYTGLARSGDDLCAYDVVLTTYGTLRRDALILKDIEFDYVVLDEAQAVKNAGTESAKAVRLLRGSHRLAMSGTPIENHLGELFSLFEFLNPGMLGAASVFKLAGAAARKPDEDTCRLLAQALRPFILRRTKEQVARELPPKTQQTISCEMEPAQRKLYNELRQHYRDSLLSRIDKEGLAKSKIQVLEALLRLRQAACHPGLIDIKRSGENSAKLDALLEQLNEAMEGGHKALVFSQFTSFLKIVRSRLDAEGIVYEYLDGATKDRQARVERFQNDEKCPLFLISLKAGGLGLNLTAAEYVFLLDPWWNPAVEAQAVDRAHRIGQTRKVFAYRLIARDTVEEKVLELQKTKQNLADAIISADNSLIRTLKREDLELLLS